MGLVSRALVVALVLLFTALSLNAYACLVPVYSGVRGGDCSTPAEQQARQFCDGFKTLGVQAPAPAHPLPDSLVQEGAGGLALLPVLAPSVSFHHELSAGPPLLGRDLLSLISVLRL